jgi:hypothetical protein
MDEERRIRQEGPPTTDTDLAVLVESAKTLHEGVLGAMESARTHADQRSRGNRKLLAGAIGVIAVMLLVIIGLVSVQIENSRRGRSTINRIEANQKSLNDNQKSLDELIQFVHNVQANQTGGSNSPQIVAALKEIQVLVDITCKQPQNSEVCAADGIK